jgi:ribosomal protein S4
MRQRFHSLKHPVRTLQLRKFGKIALAEALRLTGRPSLPQKVRQTWSKYNLYNLHRLEHMRIDRGTFYQQKWKAKSMSRGYHGEQIREKQWQRMYRSNMPSVTPMNHTYLARTDGSDQSAGRGSGLDSEEETLPSRGTPYTNMVYAPIERRLDTAIFRALFASSTRQARQFVVHGAVKVNGKKVS